jgi:hypothetical protein
MYTISHITNNFWAQESVSISVSRSMSVFMFMLICVFHGHEHGHAVVVHVYVYMYHCYSNKRENSVHHYQFITILEHAYYGMYRYTISYITNNFWAQEWQQNIFFWEILEVGP